MRATENGRNSHDDKPCTTSDPDDGLPQHTTYENWSHRELIARVNNLETQLQSQQAQLRVALTKSRPQTTSKHIQESLSSPLPLSSRTPLQVKSKPAPSPFDFSAHPTRHIALKFSYLGQYYNGFEHANGTVNPLPTVEEVLWKALRKARLIAPELPVGSDTSYDVVWDTRERLRRYGRRNSIGKKIKKIDKDWGENGGVLDGGGVDKQQEIEKERLDVVWDGCEYSKCGRTDRGVSAFGQVVALRVRSRLKQRGSSHQAADMKSGVGASQAVNGDETEPDRAAEDDEAEIPYALVLNSILPSHLRVHAVCLDPQSDFDARFSCVGREYRYFFTNPAFCPERRSPDHASIFTAPVTKSAAVPQATLMSTPSSDHLTPASGYLDVNLMRAGAQQFVGLHDFRHFCKIDPTKSLKLDPHDGTDRHQSFLRRITHCDVVEVDPDPFNTGLISESHSDTIDNHIAPTVRTYAFVVHGSAFLWHQVRCMVAALFLVGQGLEDPSIVTKLLDVNSPENRGKGRPEYQMADDTGLVLWDCQFGKRRVGNFHDDDGNGDSINIGIEDTVAEAENAVQQKGPSGQSRQPTLHEDSASDRLKWIYLGDSSAHASLAAYYGASTRPSRMKDKSDGLYGPGGLLEEAWALWRSAKLGEILRGQMLNTVLRSQANFSTFSANSSQSGSVVQTAAGRDEEVNTDMTHANADVVGGTWQRSPGSRVPTDQPLPRNIATRKGTRIFDGGDRVRNVGKYIPLMARSRLDSPEVLGRKYLVNRGWRRAAGIVDNGDDHQRETNGDDVAYSYHRH